MTGGRRAALVAAILALACALVVATRCAGAPAAAPRNVLLLVTDTLRADRCSFLGYGRPTTPRLDLLARESVVFEDAWSPAPWTLPAHAALFTGREPWDLGIVGNSLVPVPPDVPSMASLFKASGRATFCVSASPWVSPSGGLTWGFDRYVPTYRGGTTGEAKENHALVLRWMREQRQAGRPFFAFVNDTEPHTPYEPPHDLARQFLGANRSPEVVQAARTIQLKRGLRISLGQEPLPADLRAAMSDLYDAEIAGMDAEIGALIDAMRAEGLLDDTLLVIAGDHGEGLGDHGWIEHGVRVDRELLRVPLLIRFPGGRGGGTRIGDVVRLHDVLPTLLEECGLDVPAGVTGRSLQRDLGGRVALARERMFDDLIARVADVTSQEAVAPLRRTRRSAYDGRFHLVCEDDAAPLLYDVRADPGETHDVATQFPADVERLRALLPR